MLLRHIAPLEDSPEPLTLTALPDPTCGDSDLLVKVSACGVCHTELDEIEGRTPPRELPVIPGHQVIGTVAELGRNVHAFSVGERVGVGWIHSACGTCAYCQRGEENLCPSFRATGRDVHGGYAQFMTVPAEFAHRIPPAFSDAEAAPLLCAGAIGYRSLRLADMHDGYRLGLAGFGASAHLVAKLVHHLFPRTQLFVFSRSEGERRFAEELGAAWSGDFTDTPPVKLDRIIDTTPAWKPVVESLHHLAPGGRLTINAIRKEPHDQDSLSRLDYAEHLWMEKEVKSVANVTRADIREFLEIASRAGLTPEVEEFPLEEANRALRELKERKIRGAKVLRTS
jgi:propanol-preferring alcohol dehydrogenase